MSNSSSLLTYAPLLALAVISTGGVSFFFLRKKLSLSHSAPAENKSDERMKEIQRYISKTQYLENVADLGEVAANQLNQISERYHRFQELLLLKFEPEELTFGRYYSAAEQTYLSILDHLKLVASTLNSIDSINIKHIQERMNELEKKPNDRASQDEFKSLDERKHLREKQISMISDLFSFNERAITEFDRVSAALSEIKTRKGESDIGLDSAIADLQNLAKRAKKYEMK